MNTRTQKEKAFTLIELMVVVSIIAALAALALPTFAKLTSNSRATTVVNDLRQFRNASESFILENNIWPPDTTPGVFDPLLAGYMSQHTFESETPLGGNWDLDASNATFAVGIVNPNYSDADFATVDSLVDDGNLSTGNFQKFGSGYYLIVAE